METIRKAIEHLSNGDRVLLSLFRINKTREVVKASTFAVSIKKSLLHDYFAEVVAANIETLNDFTDIAEYNGDDRADKLQWISARLSIVDSVLTAIKDAKKCVEREWISTVGKADIASKDPKGVLLEYTYQGKSVVMCFSAPLIRQLKSPMFSLAENRFSIVKGPVLVLPLKMDFMRFDDRVYFLSGRGLKMCISPEVVASRAKSVVDDMVEANSIENPDLFEKFATTGHNPRRLIKFDKSRFDRITNARKGKSIREKFGLMWSKGKLVVDSQADAEKLIKVVCSRGMVDPFTDGAVEVTGAEKWK